MQAGTRWNVVVFGGLGGRLDQEAQNLNALFTWSDRFEHMCILTEDCVTALLPRGTSTVEVCVPYEGRAIGLLPVGGPVASLTTSGLRWDVTAWRTAFGGAISTSNRAAWYDEASRSGGSGHDGSEAAAAVCYPVSVTASDPLVWSSSISAAALVAAWRATL